MISVVNRLGNKLWVVLDWVPYEGNKVCSPGSVSFATNKALFLDK